MSLSFPNAAGGGNFSLQLTSTFNPLLHAPIISFFQPYLSAACPKDARNTSFAVLFPGLVPFGRLRAQQPYKFFEPVCSSNGAGSPEPFDLPIDILLLHPSTPLSLTSLSPRLVSFQEAKLRQTAGLNNAHATCKEARVCVSSGLSVCYGPFAGRPARCTPTIASDHRGMLVQWQCR